MSINIRFLRGVLGILLLTGMGVTELSAANGKVRIDVLVVRAGDHDGGIDSSLKAYASTLQRLFRFNSYKLLKKQGLQIELPGSKDLSLPMGQTLTIKAEGPAGKTVRADLDWKRGSQSLLHTRVQLRPGKPAVLGGPRSENGTLLLILVAK